MALNQEGIPITSAAYCRDITEAQFSHVFRSSTHTVGNARSMHVIRDNMSFQSIPMAEARINNLREVGSVLARDFSGSFTECIRRCAHSSQVSIAFISSTIPTGSMCLSGPAPACDRFVPVLP